MGNKAYDFSSKKKDFLPKNDQIWPKTGIFGQFGPGLFSALLMGRLVVVARGLYLARHLFTLYFFNVDHFLGSTVCIPVIEKYKLPPIQIFDKNCPLKRVNQKFAIFRQNVRKLELFW